MTADKILLSSAAALFLMMGSALAVTVENKSSGEITIGVDYGNKEDIKEIAAGKSVKLDCPDGCGITGPWGFSWWAKGDDTISTKGQSLVTVE